MTDLIDTTEMYLKSIFELEEDGVVPMRARIAERLGHSGPTVSQTVARMERDGLLTLDDERHLQLTTLGRLTAVRVMRKHRLAERLLVDVIGLDLAYVHDEACRWEHVMSERVERRILGLIASRTHSPYGNPIPGLDELDVPEDERPDPASPDGPAEHLLDLASEQARTVRVHRIGEPAQVDPEVVALLADAGVLPGRTVSVRLREDRVVVTPDQASEARGVSLPHDVAAHIFAGDG